MKCPDCGEQVVCPNCGPVKLVVAEPKPASRRWRRCALAALALLAVLAVGAVCGWLRGEL